MEPSITNLKPYPYDPNNPTYISRLHQTIYLVQSPIPPGQLNPELLPNKFDLLLLQTGLQSLKQQQHPLLHHSTSSIPLDPSIQSQSHPISISSDQHQSNLTNEQITFDQLSQLPENTPTVISEEEFEAFFRILNAAQQSQLNQLIEENIPIYSIDPVTAMRLCRAAWNAVPVQTIQTAWTNTGLIKLEPMETLPEEDYLPLDEIDEINSDLQVLEEIGVLTAENRMKTNEILEPMGESVIDTRLWTPEEIFHHTRSQSQSSQPQSSQIRSSQSQPTQPKTQDISTQDISTQDISTQDISTQDITTQDISTHDLSTHDLSTHDISTHDISTHDLSTHDISTHDLSTHDSQTGDLQTQSQPQTQTLQSQNRTQNPSPSRNRSRNQTQPQPQTQTQSQSQSNLEVPELEEVMKSVQTIIKYLEFDDTIEGQSLEGLLERFSRRLNEKKKKRNEEKSLPRIG
ncbi:hypothetical protein DFH28DRAFT_1186945 [Melampsora americana]|nr:hypothetical protein DFH28DRAFT_1186945 [Melampsora americana]